MWGFVRILSGPSAGGYSHDLFVRGKEDLCKDMKRIKIKGSPEKRLKPIRCPNTRLFPPPMSSILKEMSREKISKSPSQKENRKPSRRITTAFFETTMGLTAKGLFRDADASESSSYDDFEVDLFSIEPLPIDSWQDGASSCALLKDLASLLE
jgi:hypothetical protein